MREQVARTKALRSKKRLEHRAAGFLLIAQDMLEGAHRLGQAVGPDPKLWKARRLLRRALLQLLKDADE